MGSHFPRKNTEMLEYRAAEEGDDPITWGDVAHDAIGIIKQIALVGLFFLMFVAIFTLLALFVIGVHS